MKRYKVNYMECDFNDKRISEDASQALFDVSQYDIKVSMYNLENLIHSFVVDYNEVGKRKFSYKDDEQKFVTICSLHELNGQDKLRIGTLIHLGILKDTMGGVSRPTPKLPETNYKNTKTIKDNITEHAYIYIEDSAFTLMTGSSDINKTNLTAYFTWISREISEEKRAIHLKSPLAGADKAYIRAKCSFSQLVIKDFSAKRVTEALEKDDKLKSVMTKPIFQNIFNGEGPFGFLLNQFQSRTPNKRENQNAREISDEMLGEIIHHFDEIRESSGLVDFYVQVEGKSKPVNIWKVLKKINLSINLDFNPFARLIDSQYEILANNLKNELENYREESTRK